jgi:hypothetical protein
MRLHHAIGLVLVAGCGSLIAMQKSVADLAGRRGFEWSTHAIPGFVVHVEPGSVSAGEVESILNACAVAKGHVLDYVRAPDYAATVAVFAVDTRERMQDLIGRETNAMAYHSSNSMCLVWPRAGSSAVRHELFHLVAMNTWGIPERWINEGMAVDAAGPWLGGDLLAACRASKDRGELPSLYEITRRFGRMPSLRAYPAAGGFVRFVRDAWGFEALRAVWEGGARTLPTVTGLGLEELEAA